MSRPVLPGDKWRFRLRGESERSLPVGTILRVTDDYGRYFGDRAFTAKVESVPEQSPDESERVS